MFTSIEEKQFWPKTINFDWCKSTCTIFYAGFSRSCVAYSLSNKLGVLLWFFLRSAHTRGHVTGTWSEDMLQWQFAHETCLFLYKKVLLQEQTFVPKTPHEIQLVRIHASWSRGKKWPQFSILHHMHCSWKVSSLQHRNKLMSTLCAPACILSLQHDMCPTHTQKGACPSFMSSQHVS